MHDGMVVPSVLVLSHQEQRERLRRSCPEAVARSVVAGDPCIDQLRASTAFRETYRQALGIRPGQKLVVVSSTWGRGSLLGSPEPDVLRRALAELPTDEYRVVAAIHPNAWYGHGAWQVHSWLTPFLDAGLLLPVPDTETWKAALVAADVLIGDHGSLTMYGVALGVPCVLGSFPADGVAAGSPMERIGQVLPRLASHRPLGSQLEDALVAQPGDPGLEPLRALVTSRPGESAALLRRLIYQYVHLAEPAAPAATRLVPVPAPVTASRQTPGCPAMFVSVSTTHDGTATTKTTEMTETTRTTETATVRRYPAALQSEAGRHLKAAHLVADLSEPDVRWSRAADVLLLPRGRTPIASAASLQWTRLTGRHPGCSLVVVEESEDGCLTLLPDGRRLSARWAEHPRWADFAIAGSLVYDYVYGHAGSAGRESQRSPAPFGVRASAGDGQEPGLLLITES
ncbi:hypothetical protein QMK19_27925 [Streptomyces sp. H10-C2]|uniref:hypothetical protein n=1 Tax=unclassified Streptomyces TaxID=2593676 RepID=UPI0024B95EF2|nr:MULTISPECIES: hypothetical protein [unclassified Streptomyces]MDJ0343939.1 hypothetical protein [Streptomyces sp. PH10-H1]MDJ0373380.1 hypothetical protein [Streptomyces sp. H10-C2]